MAARIRGTLATQRNLESLWSSWLPCFLAPALRSFSISRPNAATNERHSTRKQVHRDTYTLRQVQRRKEANIGRQALIREQIKKESGDPIRGVETDFVRSFDADNGSRFSSDPETSNADLGALNVNRNEPQPFPPLGSSGNNLDHGINPVELQEALRFSDLFTEPLPPAAEHSSEEEVQKGRSQHQEWESRSKNASEAIRRIVSIHNGSNMHRTKRNVERIITELGRHTTDNLLKSRASTKQTNPNVHTTTPRAGPDTGSSEVQIGILTAKIRVLANRYEGEAKHDKMNKRNLRLLLHRRQKLLKYMERRERGSERWTYMLKTLGLTPATWRGEISVQ